MKKTIIYLIILLLFSSCLCRIQGSYDLGENFAWIEGDKLSHQELVYCSSESKCCSGGISIIPSSKDTITKYLVSAKSNKKWIIAKGMTLKNVQNYWVINKKFKFDSKYKESPLSREEGKEFKKIIFNNVIGPLNKEQFDIYLNNNNIPLDF